MSYEQVKKEMMKLGTEEEVTKVMDFNLTRFERLLKTCYNADWKRKPNNIKIYFDKDEYFERHKSEITNNFLLFLNDVYDYKRPDHAPKLNNEKTN